MTAAPDALGDGIANLVSELNGRAADPTRDPPRGSKMSRRHLQQPQTLQAALRLVQQSKLSQKAASRHYLYSKSENWSNNQEEKLFQSWLLSRRLKQTAMIAAIMGIWSLFLCLVFKMASCENARLTTALEKGRLKNETASQDTVGYPGTHKYIQIIFHVRSGPG